MPDDPKPPLPPQQQPVPGHTADMDPKPDHGEESYRGSGKLEGRCAIITGGDSGIGRAIAIAFAREGADLLISYLDEHEDAKETARWVQEAGRKVELVPGGLENKEHCRRVIDRAVTVFGRLDILVNNAAFQMTRESLEEVPDEEWEHTFATNIGAIFYLCKAALPHLGPGSSILSTSSITSDKPPE